jgi:hypothetical protein
MTKRTMRSPTFSRWSRSASTWGGRRKVQLPEEGLCMVSAAKSSTPMTK